MSMFWVAVCMVQVGFALYTRRFGPIACRERTFLAFASDAVIVEMDESRLVRNTIHVPLGKELVRQDKPFVNAMARNGNRIAVGTQGGHLHVFSGLNSDENGGWVSVENVCGRRGVRNLALGDNAAFVVCVETSYVKRVMGTVVEDVGAMGEWSAVEEGKRGEVWVGGVSGIHRIDEKKLFDEGRISCMGVSDDGSNLVRGGDDRNVVVFDVLEGMKRRQVFTGHSSTILSVAFLDGDRIASVAGRWDPEVRVWSILDGSLVGKEKIELGGRQVCVLGNGVDLVLLGTSRLWFWGGGENGRMKPLDGHFDEVTSASFRDGGVVATGSSDRSIVVWDLESETSILAELASHKFDVTSVAWSVDGMLLASGSWDKRVSLWEVDLQNKRLVKKSLLIGLNDHVAEVLWSHDGKSLAATSTRGGLAMWGIDSSDVELLWSIPMEEKTHWRTAAWSPTGNELLVGGNSECALVFLDRDTGDIVHKDCNVCRVVQSIAWNTNTNQIAVGCENRVVYVQHDNSTWLPFRSESSGHFFAVTHLAWSPDASLLASVDTIRPSINIWSISTRSLFQHIPTSHVRPIVSLSWKHSALWSISADGSILSHTISNWTHISSQ